MGERTTFRFAAVGVAFEFRGPEEFVLAHLGDFLPFVKQVASGRKPAGGGDSGTTQGPVELAAWYRQHVPEGTRLSMQDSILAFALWMRTFKKYIFTSEDVRRAFMDVGQPEPKSLLQILGTLKRDHNLILGTERRGEYMLNTTGIERARRLLGIRQTRTTQQATRS